MNSSYFDHAATTPMRQVAVSAWLEHAGALNPASQYGSGRRARSVLDASREQIATLLGCEAIEVIFTASGTEADNLAVQGLYAGSSSTRVVSTRIEHPGVLETLKALPGADVEMLPMGKDGRVSSFELLDAPAAVATMMWANNETGAIQPVKEFILRAGSTPTHIDAVQAVGHVPVHFDALGVTTLAASAHKFGGPRGVGLLLAKRSPAPSAIVHGGGQERGIRPGTVDVAGAAATAAALAEAVADMDDERKRLEGLRDKLQEGILERVDNVMVHTTAPSLPGHVHLSFPGAEGDSLIMLFDSLGIEAATGSACSNGVNRASHVLLAMGISESDARGAIRFTLGHTTTEEDIDAVLSVIGDVVSRARLAGLAF